MLCKLLLFAMALSDSGTAGLLAKSSNIPSVMVNYFMTQQKRLQGFRGQTAGELQKVRSLCTSVKINAKQFLFWTKESFVN